MEEVTIFVEYMGVVRLLLKKKNDTFHFTHKPKLKTLLDAIAAKYGGEMAGECKKQLFVLYREGDASGKVVGLDDILENKSLVKIASLMAGG